MVDFIDDHRDEYGVEPICRVLPIAPSTYHEQKARQVDPARLPKRLVRDAHLREEVEFATLEWVDWFNNRRVLEPIGDVPPAEFEAMYYEGLEGPAKEAGLN